MFALQNYKLMATLQNIRQLMAADRLDEALSALGEMPEPTAESLFLKGKVYWRMGRRSEATNCYMAAAALDPESPAVQALEQARDIESFFNPDLLNP